MHLNDDQIEEIADAYHNACRARLKQKIELYAAAKETPNYRVFAPCPADWIQAVADTVEKIILENQCKL